MTCDQSVLVCFGRGRQKNAYKTPPFIIFKSRALHSFPQDLRHVLLKQNSNYASMGRILIVQFKERARTKYIGAYFAPFPRKESK